MIVKLPRTVHGAELIEVMKATLGEMQNREVFLNETPRYESGSLKKVTDKCQITVWQTKNNSRRHTKFNFSIQEVIADDNYEKLDISVEEKASWWLFIAGILLSNIENNPERFRHIEGLIEQFLIGVFQKLSAPSTA